MAFLGRIKNVLPNAATIINGDALPVTGGTLGAQLSAKAAVAQEDWITPTLLNSWAQVSAATPVRYRKNQFNEIEIVGSVKNGSLDTVVFNLPVGYRPKWIHQFATYSYNNSLGLVRVNDIYNNMGGTAGDIKISYGNTATISLCITITGVN